MNAAENGFFYVPLSFIRKNPIKPVLAGLVAISVKPPILALSWPLSLIIGFLFVVELVATLV